MNPLKRYAAAMLIASMALALITPAYIAYAIPGSGVYHRNLMVLVTQTLPYFVCAVLWLPSRHPSAPRIVFNLATLLFAAACVLYVPSLVHPRSGGDMVGLFYIIACLVTTLAVVVISLIAFVVLLFRRSRVSRSHRGWQ